MNNLGWTELAKSWWEAIGQYKHSPGQAMNPNVQQGAQNGFRDGFEIALQELEEWARSDAADSIFLFEGWFGGPSVIRTAVAAVRARHTEPKPQT